MNSKLIVTCIAAFMAWHGTAAADPLSFDMVSVGDTGNAADPASGFGSVLAIFGARTADGLRNFQRDYGMVADGICGPHTLKALRQLARRVTGGRPQLLREMVAVAAAGPGATSQSGVR